MQVRVRYFAIFREATGVDTERVETNAASARELFAEMAEKHSAMRSEPAALVAINDQMSDWHSPIRDGDVILFFPPVAGG